ncbi:MAG: ABC transporter substrate-binding protein [Deltaproteobacteria bacterium CG07_land_8_20_14_0_80_38_7]|nr:MAG: ABC transporter substrate-binding protein [Deltaproteobacteria bacterium CG07_land_8_20_14_0_80_38_7]
MKKIIQMLIISFFSICFIGNLFATELKLAILAPEGSAWERVMRQWNDELSKRTNGALTLKIYAGGVLGDERDVVRKIQIGQVNMGGFTGLGLGIVNPEVRVLELPMLFDSYDEIDYVTAKIQPLLENGFRKKGFELLGWAETGFVYIYSASKPISTIEDMHGMKMWMWEGDPLVKTMYDKFGIVPIPLALPDVLSSLSTKLIDAVYAPPLGAIALQWFTKTKYMTDLKLANSTGGILISSKIFNSLPDNQKKILKETAEKYSKMLVEQTRKDNEKSITTLAKAGIKTVAVPAEEVKQIAETSKKVWTALAGNLYSEDLLNKVVAAVEEYKAKK